MDSNSWQKNKNNAYHNHIYYIHCIAKAMENVHLQKCIKLYSYKKNYNKYGYQDIAAEISSPFTKPIPLESK